MENENDNDNGESIEEPEEVKKKRKARVEKILSEEEIELRKKVTIANVKAALGDTVRNSERINKLNKELVEKIGKIKPEELEDILKEKKLLAYLPSIFEMLTAISHFEALLAVMLRQNFDCIMCWKDLPPRAWWEPNPTPYCEGINRWGNPTKKSPCKAKAREIWLESRSRNRPIVTKTEINNRKVLAVTDAK